MFIVPPPARRMFTEPYTVGVMGVGHDALYLFGSKSEPNTALHFAIDPFAKCLNRAAALSRGMFIVPSPDEPHRRHAIVTPSAVSSAREVPRSTPPV